MRHTIDVGQLEQAQFALDKAAATIEQGARGVESSVLRHAVAAVELGESVRDSADVWHDSAVLIRAAGRDVMVGLVAVAVVFLVGAVVSTWAMGQVGQ